MKILVVFIIMFIWIEYTTYSQNYTAKDYILLIKELTIKIDKELLPDVVLFQTRAEAYIAIEKYSEAILDYNKISSIQNKLSAENSFNRGVCYYYKKQYKSAIKDFDICVKARYNHSLAYFNIGNCYFSENNFQEAILNFKQALKDSVDNVEILNNIGLCYMKLDNIDLAITYFSKSLFIQPDKINSLFNRGYCYFIQKQYQFSEIDLERGLKIAPENYFVNYYLGLLNFELGNQSQSCLYFNKAKLIDSFKYNSEKIKCTNESDK